MGHADLEIASCLPSCEIPYNRPLATSSPSPPPYHRRSVEDDYELGRVLGKGSYGTVRLVRDRRDGTPWACKTISKNRLLRRRDVADIRREVELLNLLTPHANIAGVRKVYEDAETVSIVMDYCAGGELFSYIVDRQSLSEREAAELAAQMVEVVRHCHSMGVMHRDMKPENFLLTSREPRGALKACDFGLSTYFKPGEVLTDLVGSAYYVAPEVLQRRYGPECDLWSLGVILYVLLSGLPPFWGQSDREIFGMILKADLDLETAPWPTVSDEAKRLVRGLLRRDPAQRLTLDQVRGSPWLRDMGALPSAPLPPIVLQRMRAFTAMTRFKKAAVLCAARHLNRDQIQGLRELFKSFDKNGW